MDFDDIMGIDWLAACYDTIDCRAKASIFHFSGEPVLECVGNTVTPRGKANFVADALSCQSIGSLAHVEDEKRERARELHQLSCLVVWEGKEVCGPRVGRVERVKSVAKEAIVRAPQIWGYQLGGRLCVPDVAGLRDRIMSEAHYSWHSIHPRSTKMYHDIKDVYWWNDMKNNIAEFVA
ncbi:uncharacterized protein [Nicotiana tomentosiformis]|uniref:uncharacterized protein n=1 Tax=Nicotiana tomentosiformis TaxID=4098 RepID=UPI00388CE620